MSDEQDIRRVGRKDRKDRLKPSGPLFPPEDDQPTDADDDSRWMPPPEQETSPPASRDFTMDEVVDEVVSQMPQMPPEPQKIRTPPEERYPPVVPPLPLEEKQPTAAPQPTQYTSGKWHHNVIALIFALGTVGLIVYFAYLWQNPFSSLNVLPPPTPFVFVTETPMGFGAAAEPTPAAQTTAIATASVVTPTPPVRADGFPFTVAGLLYVPNDNGRGCDWASIAGTVTGLNGEPLNSYRIQVTNADDPDQLEASVFSGSAQTIGAGGFELPLGGTPTAGRYTVQLHSRDGVPLSGEILVETSTTCDENVALVNFTQVEAF